MQSLTRLFVAASVIVSCALPAVPAENDDPLKSFMRVKLNHSQNVLEALLTEDFTKIASNAQEMSLLSLAETWQVLTTQDYIEFSRKFRNAADSLADMAKKKDLDRTTQAFNQVTTRCVECHKYVRTVRLVDSNK